MGKDKGAIVIVVIAVFVIGGYWAYRTYGTAFDGEGRVCTQEVKQCPDGSYVSRTGPQCEFAACPKAKAKTSATDTSAWETYRDEKYGFEVKYPRDLSFYDEEGPYDRIAEGIGDWTIALKSKQDIENRFRCDALKDDYLPVDFAEPNLCKIEQIRGRPLLYGIGIFHYFEGTDRLMGIIIYFREKDWVMFGFEDIIPPIPGATQRLADEYLKKNPDTEWPNAKFAELSELVTSSLREEISKSDGQLRAGMDALKKIAQTFVTF